ncbi:MAG: hypothetical protein CL663_03720 [Bacteroidetes bacterium]|nr:hypothetical protein [Bacteroidota bacterium]
MKQQKVTLKDLKFVLLIIFGIGFLNVNAQIGGQSTYAFLNLENSARIAALGGASPVALDDDLSLAIANPSLIRPSMDQQLTFSFVDYFSDINYGFVSYSKDYDRLGSFVASVQFIDYGTFKYANEAGVQQGEFGASEFALILGWGRELTQNFRIGANSKFIYSNLEQYNSIGLAVDLSATYMASRTDFVASVMILNAGRQLKAYRSGNIEPLPFEIRFALSNKLKHIPFRYHLMLTHLEKFDLTYVNPLLQNDFGQSIGEASLAEKMMSHVVVGGEILFSENFTFRFGYNYRRRQEMKVDSKFSTVGFSWGFGIKVSKFQFNYARSAYHLVGSPNYITMIVNLSDF